MTRTPSSDYGAHTANYTLFFLVTQNGTTLNFELATVDFVRGKLEQTVQFGAVQSTFPTALTQHLTKVADGRL